MGRGDDGCFHHNDATAMVFRVSPTKVLAFGKNPYTHTRYQF